MRLNKLGLLALIIGIATTSGCATYRTDSNVESAPTSKIDTNTHVIVTEGRLPGKKYTEIGPIEVSVKKLTDRKSTRLNSSHTDISRMPSPA